MRTEKLLYVVIVSFNGKDLLQVCLNSLLEQSYKTFEVVVVDNGSSDGTVKFLAEHFPRVEVIELQANHGFAYPNNLGISKALENPETSFIVTLNNDTLPDPDYLKNLVSCASRNPRAGSVQPKIVNYYDQSLIDSTGILVSRNMSAINRGLRTQDIGQFQQEEEVFGAAASAALYTRDALEGTVLKGKGGAKEFFDSDYFAYYEDVDLAWRLRLAGYCSMYTPEAKVLHMHSATGKNFSPFKAFHIHRNQYFNIIKNLPGLYMWGALARMPLLYWGALCSMTRKKGPAAHLAESGSTNPLLLVLKGWGQLLLHLPTLLSKRRQIQRMRRVPNSEIDSWFQKYKADFDKVVFGD